MAVRQFDGVDDDIRHTVGSALADMTYGTVALLFKPQPPIGDWHAPLTIAYDDRSTSGNFYIYEDGNDAYLGIYSERAGTGDDIELGPFNRWYLVVVYKGPNVDPALISFYDYVTGQWTHDSTKNFWEWWEVGPDGIIQRSDTDAADGGHFRGLLAVQAMWANRVPPEMTEDIEAIGLEESLQAWFDAEPDALWTFNQNSVTDPVNDLVGDAHQIARVGTAVVTNDDPPGFVWGSSGDDQFGEGSVSAAATVEATGQRIIVHRGSGSALAEAVVAATGVRSAVGAGAVVAEAQVGASGERTAFAAGEVEAQASASASGERTTFGAGAVSAVSSVEAAGGRTVAGAGSVEAAASVAATGRVWVGASGHVVASSTVEAAGRRTALGEGSVEATASVSAAGVRTVRGAGSVQAESDVSAAGVRTAVGFGAVQAAATVAAVGSAKLKRGRGRVEAFVLAQAVGVRTARARGFVHARGISRVRVPPAPSPPPMAYRSWLRFRPRH